MTSTLNLPRKLFLTLSFVAMMLTMNTAQANIMIDPTSDSVQFGGLANHKPGLKLRMTQAVSELVKENLLQYGVAYMNWDLQLKKNGMIPIRAFPLFTDFHYYDLVYDPFKLDLDRAALNFTHMAIDGKPVVYLELPVVKSWRIMFDYYYKYLFGHSGTMEIDFFDTKAIFTTELKATTDGHIYPHLHDFKINIEKTKLYHTNWFSEFIYRQIFDLSKYIIQSAYNMFGASVINKNIYEITKKRLNDQIYEFEYDVGALGRKSKFNLNWRMTADPEIHDHELDFSLFFDIGPESRRCMVPAD